MLKRITAILLLCFLCVSALPGAFAAPCEQAPDRCTAVYVGKAVCAEGTMLIGRCEDADEAVLNKLFFVRQALADSGGEMVDTGAEQKGFSVEIPEQTLKYTCLRDSSALGDGPYDACCMNEAGLVVMGTVSTKVGKEYSRIDPLKGQGDGLREAILPSLLACQARSAHEAVHLLGRYVDRYGSAECNTLLFSDPQEAWIFEIYGGTTYAAMRLPEAQMAVFGNGIMLGWADPDATDGWFFSGRLRGCLEQLTKAVQDDQGRYHLARSIDPGPRAEKNNMRTWRGQQLFAPSSAGEYSDDVFYPLLFTPEKKVSVLEIMQLFGDRYEGTAYDMRLPGNEGRRPIGFDRQVETHIVQTFPDLPDYTCHLQWLAMGNAEHAVFVPAFSGITDTFEKYRVDDDGDGIIHDSFYYVCKSIFAVASADRDFLSRGVREFNRRQEERMLEEILGSLPDVRAACARSEEEGMHFVTLLAMRQAEEQYEKAREMFSRLLYVQMYNLNGRGGNTDRIVFEMPD